ncbi:Imm49 family immunity protein [Gorillibacterium sp. CAU 1737]|uniref:Imm49 family immunity protein n=1 Tax=Gorillibacterium sp. CAU 1737 TaxID=3140362 RepID=UPI0032612099
MKKSKYIQYFPEIFNETIEEKNEHIEDFRKNGLPGNVGYYYELLADGFRDIAIGEIILNEDVVKSKQSFYLAGKMQEALYQNYDMKKNDITADCVNTNKYTALLMALISENEDLITSLAELFGGRIEEEEEDHEFNKAFGYALKNILLGQMEDAKVFIAKLKSLEGSKEMKYYDGYSKVLDGIIEKDSHQVNENLTYMIQCHKKLKGEYGDTPQELLSIPVLGLAKVAARNGIEVNIMDTLTPSELLESHTINYPVVDFID